MDVKIAYGLVLVLALAGLEAPSAVSPSAATEPTRKRIIACGHDLMHARMKDYERKAKEFADMGFDGLLITDGLEMGAVIEYSGGDSGKVCVMAVLAGVDILCDPKNPVSDYNAVLEAVRAGDISESQIDDSVRRIIRTKIRLGLYE